VKSCILKRGQENDDSKEPFTLIFPFILDLKGRTLSFFFEYFIIIVRVISMNIAIFV